MLTFKTLAKPEVEIISGLEIPKRGCLTVAEEAAIRSLGATLEEHLKGLTPLQADLELKQQVVSILIKSRLDQVWTIEDTKNPQWIVQINESTTFIEPDMELLDSLYEFFMGEQRRWKSLDEAPQQAEGKAKKK